MAPTGRHLRGIPIPRYSIENSLQKLVKKLECDPTVGSLDTVLLRRYSGPVGGMTPTVHRRRVVPIPRISMENSLQKHVKKFESNPSVGSLDTNLLSRYSSLISGMAQTRRCHTDNADSMQLHQEQPTETREKT